MSIWARIKEHKVLQWTLGYAAAAYTLLHGVEMVGNAFHLAARGRAPRDAAPDSRRADRGDARVVSRAQGHQRVGRQEIAVLAVLVVLAGGVLWFFGRPGEEHADAKSEAIARAAPARAAPEAKSLAVLPFDNRSGDKGQDFYADGLTDELTTALARISGLKVIASSSTGRYKGSDKRPSEISRDLGVASLVTGSVLRADGRIRYTASLISADTEQNIWAESYERDERDVLTLQSEVAGAIAKAIEVPVKPGGIGAPRDRAHCQSEGLRGVPARARALERADGAEHPRGPDALRELRAYCARLRTRTRRRCRQLHHLRCSCL
jgi:TolB-like protein